MKSKMLIHPDELSKKWIDKLADAGVDVLGLHPVGGGKAAQSLKELTEAAGTEAFRALVDYAESRGLETVYECHAAGYLLPRELFLRHPEYFRQNEKGERSADKNFCVSNTEALDIFAKNAAELASRLYKSKNEYYFWMDDVRNARCHCEKCKDLSASDQQLIAVNAMLKEIKKHRPDAKAAYLAYADTVSPPQRVKADPGVFLEYAPMEKYKPKTEGWEQRVEKERKMLPPLLELFGKQDAKVLEYWYDNSLFSGWKKPPKKFTLDRDGMEKNIAEYKNIGFSEISTFACYLGNDYTELYGDVDIAPFAECIAEENRTR